MKKTVFLIINSLNGGGAEHVAARLSKEWTKKYNLFVISLSDFTEADYDFEGEKISISSSKKNWFAKMKSYINEIDKLAKKYEPIAMISFLHNASLSMILTKYKCKKIISIRNYIKKQYSGVKLFFWELIVKKIYSKANVIVSVSKTINEEMIREYKILEEKCKYIYNPYDHKQIIDKAQEELSEVEKNFYKDSFIISNVGHVSKQKGQISLIKAIKYLTDKNLNVKLVIVGKDNSSFANELKNLVKEYQISDKVLFTGINKNPYKYVSKSNLFVFPSLYEGFPNALVEAMICGVPVIANDCLSGPKEILDPENSDSIEKLHYGEFGILVPNLPQNLKDSEKEFTKTEVEIINAIEELYNNSDIRNKYAIKEMTRTEEFSISKICNKWEKIIEEE